MGSVVTTFNVEDTEQEEDGEMAADGLPGGWCSQISLGSESLPIIH